MIPGSATLTHPILPSGRNPRGRTLSAALQTVLRVDTEAAHTVEYARSSAATDAVWQVAGLRTLFGQ